MNASASRTSPLTPGNAQMTSRSAEKKKKSADVSVVGSTNSAAENSGTPPVQSSSRPGIVRSSHTLPDPFTIPT
ncbi:MAG TPA: hypothetical protein VM510_03935 [Caulifigura sp.]|nr:hypothetical protein [Caulifigura sp.]